MRWDERTRTLDVLHSDARQRNQANLSFGLHVHQGFNRCIKRDGRIEDSLVKIINVDSIKAQSSQAAFYRFTQVRRTCIMGLRVRVQDDSIPLWSRSRDPWGMEGGLRRSTLR